MKKKLLTVFFIAAAFIGILCLMTRQSHYFLNLGTKNIQLLLASDGISRQQGLSGMKKLQTDSGMLFIFDTPDKQGIWMKDMNFPIDIMWLDSDGKIIYFEKNVSPSTFPHVFFPPEDSLYVLELNAGFIDQNQLTVGKKISFIKK